jgi:hypothetical protein
LNYFPKNLLPKGRILDIRSGGNSRVYRYSLESGEDLAVKIYGAHVSLQDKKRESWVYAHWQNQHEICSSREQFLNEYCLITDWFENIDGDFRERKLDAILSFIDSGRILYTKLDSKSFFFAKDSITDSHSLLNQIENRLFRIETSPVQNSEIHNLSKQIREISRKFGKSSNELDFCSEGLLPSQSDIGFHNVLVNNTGTKIIDFEFFGLDSPYKLVGDFLLHPRNLLNSRSFNTFMDYSIHSMKIEEGKLGVAIPLLALKWSLIILKRAQMPNIDFPQKYIELSASYVSLAKSQFFHSDWESSLYEFFERKESD